jgi:hypothetical protein
MKEKYPLYVIRASYYKAIRRTLDKFLVQQEVPHGVHELVFAVDLNFRLWQLFCLLLILTGKVSAEL